MEKEKQLTVHRGGHLEALLNGCPEAILAIDANGIIKFANREACILTEREMNELVGENIVIVYENVEAARSLNRKIYEGGGTTHGIDSLARTKSGKLIPVRVSASHLIDSNGKYIGGVGYFAVYRPWAGAEAQVKARVEELEAKMEKWKDMAAPVFELFSGLCVTIVVGPLDAERFSEVAGNILSHIESANSKVVLLDLVTSVVSDDVADQLTRLIRTVRLMGANFVIAGMQLSLAKAMEPLIADLSFVKSFSSKGPALEAALNMIGYKLVEKN